ncbi:Ycf48-like protein [Asticcacaulis sp. MM231]|uniref:P-loop NTPase fold protein n=1 Tax=Asticcacaulis sp. MM231 TaxID=3157666 RepID=UPI0032D5A173
MSKAQSGKSGPAGSIAVRLFQTPVRLCLFLAALCLFIGASWISLVQSPAPYVVPVEAQHDFWRWFAHPLEINAAERLALNTQDRTSAVADLGDGKHFWRATERGILWSTSNSGQTWVKRYMSVGSPLPDMIISMSFTDTNHGRAMTRMGRIDQTYDGGTTWKRVGAPDLPMYSRGFLSANQETAWKVGTSIFRTDDNGKTWSPLRGITVDESISDIAFTSNNQIGLAVGRKYQDGAEPGPNQGFISQALILLTDDGGKTWHDVSPDSHAPISSVWLGQDGTEAWAVGEKGAIFRTSDRTLRIWERVASPVDVDLLFVQMAKNGTGWIGGLDGAILSRSDGRTWRVGPGTTSSGVSGVFVTEESKAGFAVLDDGSTLLTADKGRTWSHTDRASLPQFTEVGADENTKSLHIYSRVRSVTGHDDGTGLVQANSTTFANPFTYALVDVNRRFALRTRLRFPDDGHTNLALTRDYGRTWQPIKAPESCANDNTFGDGITASASTIWSGCRDHRHVSRDFGVTWTEYKKGDLTLPRDDLTEARQNYFAQYGKKLAKTLDRHELGKSLSVEDIYFLPGKDLGWLSTSAGDIFYTMDGGTFWNPTTADYFADTVIPDTPTFKFRGDPAGRRTWVIGDNGIILFWDNERHNWRQLATPTTSAINDLIVLDKDHVVAVGDHSTVLRSNDGGKTWTSPPYRRFPAPWYVVSALVSAAMLFVAFLPYGQSPREGIEQLALSDAPISRPEDDRLDFRPRAAGISRFLRNAKTRPPITLSICGPWGSGKSTFMRLICDDMQAFGHSCIWFNAWHHQSEDSFLAGLTVAIRRSLPRLLPDGLGFRSRLLWRRLRRNWPLGLLVLALVVGLASMAVVAFVMDGRGLASLLASFACSLNLTAKCNIPFSLADTGRSVGIVASLVTIVAAIYNGTKSLGVNPEAMVRRAGSGFSLTTAQDKISFRARFAEQFEDLCEALPSAPVIVIDDLDRVHSPEVLAACMETINFLVSSGNCFVLVGMDTARVETALGLAFEKISGEYGEQNANDDNPETQAQIKRDQRRRYARKYLEKLVNIEIAVPSVAEPNLANLLGAPMDSVSTTERVLLPLARMWQAAILVSAIIFGAVGGISVLNYSPPEPLDEVVATKKPQIAQEVNSDVKSTTSYPEQTQTDSVVLIHRSGQKTGPIWIIYLSIVLSFSAVAIFYILYRARRHVAIEVDSADFSDAFSIWLPAIIAHDQTPRYIKRFANRIRYVSMMKAISKMPTDPISRFWLDLRNFGRPTGKSEAEAPSAIADNVIVALGSYYEVFGLDWEKHLRNPENETVASCVRKATHRFSTSWPPDQKQIDIFKALLAGVRVGKAP